MIKNLLFTRRQYLLSGLGAMGALAVNPGKLISQSLACSPSSAELVSPLRDFSVAGQLSLKDRASIKGLTYGADCGSLNLQSSPELAKIVIRECSILVLGFLKWNILRPTANSFDFTLGDWYADFGRQNSLLLRGHTLVWYDALPTWFQGTVNQENCQQFLIEHIQKVVGHYKGRIYSWDVVNEAISIYDGRADGLRKSPWLQFLGPDYIETAFRLAAHADPQALLVYNETDLEYETPDTIAKRDAVLRLLERLKSRNVPIHALGIQSHLSGDETLFNPQKMQAFLKNVADIGLKVLVTEMDVLDNKLPADITTRDRMVAAAYEDYLSAILESPAVVSVINWGLSDAYTWLSESYPRCDGLPVRPLPYDNQFKRKLAWNAIARAFDQAPHRRH